jgi:hypothetical protein
MKGVRLAVGTGDLFHLCIHIGSVAHSATYKLRDVCSLQGFTEVMVHSCTVTTSNPAISELYFHDTVRLHVAGILVA